VLVDTHCHLGDAAFDADREEVVARARAAGVTHLVIVADAPEASERARGLARQFGLSATAGLHPHAASQWSSQTAARLTDALTDPVVVAVGETGLDYHYDHAPRATQLHAFEAQLRLAADHRRPVIIHAREADADLVPLLTAWGRAVPALVLHSFSAGDAVFEAGLAVGAYFSFSGMITFRNWSRGDYVTRCPLDRLLVETDAPYLTPVPFRGRRNEPAYIALVARQAAELRGEPADAIALRTTENAARCFGLRLHSAAN
jgi:TatD DNase family protein